MTEDLERGGNASRTLLDSDWKDKLSSTERRLIAIVRRSFEPGLQNRFLQFCQRTVGQAWINLATHRLKRVHHLERAGGFDDDASVMIVANHRSFFDLYVIAAELVGRGLRKRIIFPVRADFFYTSWLGLVVNFLMSFLSMYPPLFRKREQAALNLVSLEELGQLLQDGNIFLGLHPEGTRKKDDDPYTFLPAQPGVGRVIHQSRVRVVPVFINGLGNNIGKQIARNFLGSGPKIHVVFGAPIEFGALLTEKGSPRVFREISERCMQEIGRLGEEERALRMSPTP
jgi:1-acyl-sn-glycerol-3-phosphate acyltransferase